MNIVLACDDKFAQHCAVTIASIFQHNRNVHIYIIMESLTTENKCKILSLAKNCDNNRIDFLHLTDNHIKSFPMPSNAGIAHISIATYYRLFIETLLSKDIHKILYLDCDIVVRKDLSELWEINMDNHALGAVYQDDPILVGDDCYDRLSIPKKYGYFNAGVLLINLDYWRQYNITEKLFFYIQNNFDKIIFHDQDVLNAVLHKETLSLTCRWNMLTVFFTKVIYQFSSDKCIQYRNLILERYKDDPDIVHYVSKPKPWDWDCRHPYKDDYYHYLSLTDWKNAKPKPSLTYQTLKNILRDKFPFTLLPSIQKGAFLPISQHLVK